MFLKHPLNHMNNAWVRHPCFQIEKVDLDTMAIRLLRMIVCPSSRIIFWYSFSFLGQQQSGDPLIG